VGIVTIASNSGSARTSSSESEVKQTSMPHVIFYQQDFQSQRSLARLYTILKYSTCKYYLWVNKTNILPYKRRPPVCHTTKGIVSNTYYL
jgi:hypothetical protein